MSFFTTVSGFPQTAGFTWAVNMPPAASADNSAAGAAVTAARASPWAAISPRTAAHALSDRDFPALEAPVSPAPITARPRVRTRAGTPVSIAAIPATAMSSPCTPSMARRRVSISPLSSPALTTPDDDMPAAPHLHERDLSAKGRTAHSNNDRYQQEYQAPRMRTHSNRALSKAAIDSMIAADGDDKRAIQQALARFFTTEIVTMLKFPGQYRAGVGGSDDDIWSKSAVERASFARMDVPVPWVDNRKVLRPRSELWKLDEYGLNKVHPYAQYGSPAHELVEFVYDLILRMNVTYSSVMTALYILKGLSLHTGDDKSVFFDALRRCSGGYSAFPGSMRVERLVAVVSLSLAGKWIEDNSYRSRSWASVTGISTQDIIRLETAALKELQFSTYIQPDLWLVHVKALLDNVVLRANNGHEDHETNEIAQAILINLLDEAIAESKPGAPRGDTLMDPFYDDLRFEPDHSPFVDSDAESDLPSPLRRLAANVVDCCSADSDDLNDDFARDEYDGAPRFLPSRLEFAVMQTIRAVQARVEAWAATVDPHGDAFEPPEPPVDEQEAPQTPAPPATDDTVGPYTSARLPKAYQAEGPTFAQPIYWQTPAGFGDREAWLYFKERVSQNTFLDGSSLQRAWAYRADDAYALWTAMGFACARLHASWYVLNDEGMPIFKASGEWKYNSTPEQLARYAAEDAETAEKVHELWTGFMNAQKAYADRDRDLAQQSAAYGNGIVGYY